jgi:hypothetical protein
MTFSQCEQLIEVEGHKKIRKIEERAFHNCPSLRRATKMTGLIEIEANAFSNCFTLSELDFDKLEIIGDYAFFQAFYRCAPVYINMPSIRRVSYGAFMCCKALTDVVFGKDLERIKQRAFLECTSLRRVAIPLKYGLIVEDEGFYGCQNGAFHDCQNLSRIDTLDGGIHKTITSLHMESWSVEMKDEIDRINQALQNIRIEKTTVIRRWVARVIGGIKHYKSEHQIMLKEAMTLLELALWKAKLLNEAGEKKCKVDKVTKKAKIDAEAARKEHRVTCGASTVIKNVLPFLALS